MEASAPPLLGGRKSKRVRLIWGEVLRTDLATHGFEVFTAERVGAGGDAIRDQPFLLERSILLCDRIGVLAPWADLHRDRSPRCARAPGRKLRRQRRSRARRSDAAGSYHGP
ncbi:hypothetical protein JDO7802_01877 [Jannaschia donghaensis]|uniref:Uncharacterized protein n=1 Tax=Jannaschia donghaensis TaxID=420998 RepID=A0A0M6YIT0_9RHOB|nr:hypothetical protein JDO7802_01877 [Jannaschia donghaensis]